MSHVGLYCHSPVPVVGVERSELLLEAPGMGSALGRSEHVLLLGGGRSARGVTDGCYEAVVLVGTGLQGCVQCAPTASSHSVDVVQLVEGALIAHWQGCAECATEGGLHSLTGVMLENHVGLQEEGGG